MNPTFRPQPPTLRRRSPRVNVKFPLNFNRKVQPSMARSLSCLVALSAVDSARRIASVVAPGPGSLAVFRWRHTVVSSGVFGIISLCYNNIHRSRICGSPADHNPRPCWGGAPARRRWVSAGSELWIQTRNSEFPHWGRLLTCAVISFCHILTPDQAVGIRQSGGLVKFGAVIPLPGAAVPAIPGCNWGRCRVTARRIRSLTVAVI